MASKVLIIDGDDQGHFFLMVDGRTLYVGDDPTHADSVLTDLQIKRIHCELEVEDGASGNGEPPSAEGVCRDLLAGGAVQLGHAHLHMEEIVSQDDVELDTLAPLPDPATAPEQAAPTSTPGGPILRKHLRVIDGPDLGLTFIVPQTGTVCVGKSHKHAEIVLH